MENSGLRLIRSSKRFNKNMKFKHTRSLVAKDATRVLLISSWTPRECGIATYSSDLLNALGKHHNQKFINVCAIENEDNYSYSHDHIKYLLNASNDKSYSQLAEKINVDDEIDIVLLQHEFGFFNDNAGAFINLIAAITKPIIVAFHTVLPKPTLQMRHHVKSILNNVDGVIVMTENSQRILNKDYYIENMPPIDVIPHGTHLMPERDKNVLKNKVGLAGKTVLSTFGLLSSGKGIETSLMALPSIIAHNPDVVFLILGVTHPVVKLQEGERYRSMLEDMVVSLNIDEHVIFVNEYLTLEHLLEYLQLTDIYLFSSKDPNQAVSGTFSYALSSGCAIVSTPFPQALETVTDDIGMLFDFGNSEQLAKAVIHLLKNRQLMELMGRNAAHMMQSNSWAHSSVKHLAFLEKTLHSFNFISAGGSFKTVGD